MLLCPITTKVNFVTSVWCCLPGSFVVKLPFFPLKLLTVFWEGTLRLCRYPIPPQTLTLVVVFLASVDSCPNQLFIRWLPNSGYFHHSFDSYYWHLLCERNFHSHLFISVQIHEFTFYPMNCSYFYYSL